MSPAQSTKRSQRVQSSCLPCRQGKLKCDKNYPTCLQCRKRGREAACSYTDAGRRYNAIKSDTHVMLEKIDRLETAITDLRAYTDRVTAAFPEASASPDNGGIEGPYQGKHLNWDLLEADVSAMIVSYLRRS